MKNQLILLFAFVFGLHVDIVISSDSEPEMNNSLVSYTPVLSIEFKQLLDVSDIADGELLFMRKCSSCHDNEKSTTHGKGPNLWNVFGRRAGSSAGFDYSEAMRQSGHTWNYATLNYYLTNTERAVPGRIMNFRGIRRDTDRAKLLLFLRSMNDEPK
ncbi:MAG: c-type cytochrome [gamma proteobacterium symbiont of Taylorina sp.]|nr:c-type cytochrome [gamma proteobacterium symbiont of Taylorina sp.]